MFFRNQDELEMCKKVEGTYKQHQKLDISSPGRTKRKKRQTINGKLRREEKLVVILRPCPYL